MRKTLTQTLLAAFCAVLACATLEGGGVMLVGARMAAWGGASGWKNPYVTDGLIAMWDGEWNAGCGVHDASATTWKDLVGDCDLVINASYTTVESDAMKVVMASDVDTRGLYGDVTYTDVEVTVKVVAETLDMKQNQQLFLGPRVADSRNDFCVIALNRNRGFLCNNGSIWGSGKSSAGLFSVTWVDGVGAYKNTEALTAYGTNASAYINIGKICIGSGGGQNFRIKNICLYSRALTASEIAANYAIDEERFNLT